MRHRSSQTTTVVFGGCGFIGNVLVQRLLAENVFGRVVVVDNLSSGKRWLLPDGVELYEQNARNVLLADIGNPGVVYYLAASPFVPTSWSDPAGTMDANVQVLQEFLENNSSQPFKLIYASSGEVYGRVSQGRAREDSEPGSQLSPYSRSRIEAENVLFRSCLKLNITTIALRLFNVIGPQATQPYFIPEMISQIAKGKVVKHGNLTTIRDFVWVGDTVAAFLAAGKREFHESFAVNVASGRGWSMSRILSTLQEIAGQLDLLHEFDEERIRPVDMKRLVGDPSFASTRLDWRACISVREALKRTYCSYIQNGYWPYEIADKAMLA